VEYLGIDWSYRRAAWCSLSDAGVIVGEGAVPADADGLARLVIDRGVDVRAVVEMMSGAIWARDQLTAAGWRVQIAHARKVRDVASLACKTDKVDARVLAELARRDLVPELWVPSLDDDTRWWLLRAVIGEDQPGRGRVRRWTVLEAAERAGLVVSHTRRGLRELRERDPPLVWGDVDAALARSCGGCWRAASRAGPPRGGRAPVSELTSRPPRSEWAPCQPAVRRRRASGIISLLSDPGPPPRSGEIGRIWPGEAICRSPTGAPRLIRDSGLRRSGRCVF
jgi:hypothetical protein